MTEVVGRVVVVAVLSSDIEQMIAKLAIHVCSITFFL